MRAVVLGLLLVGASAAAATGQTPQPFPRPGGAQPQQPAPPGQSSPVQPAPANPAPPASRPAPAAPAPPAAADTAATPSAAALVFPVYPTAQFIASYDAGRGQRYYLFGTTAAYADVVAYYRTQLKERGDTVFEQPATHMFQIGRFRDETMAFPPGVTVKDWTWGGSQGYPNPRLGGDPARYPSVIMIVPPPPAPAPSSR